MPGLSFPSVGPLDLGSPPSQPACCSSLRYYDRLRLPDALLGDLRLSLVLRYHACSLVSLVGTRKHIANAKDFVLPVSSPAVVHGDIRPSQVPELSLCMHALLSDPGGVQPVRLLPVRTAAFRCIKRVGFPSTAPEVIPMTTTIHISGLNNTACILAAPGSIPPLTRTHTGSLPTCRLGFGRMGLKALPPLTHWITTTDFIGLLLFPMPRIYLGAMNDLFEQKN